MTLFEIALLIAWAGCFAAVASLSVAEVAVIRVRRSEVLVQAETGRPRARALLVLIDDLPHVLNTIYLVVLLLQVFVAITGGFLTERWFGNIGITVATIATTSMPSSRFAKRRAFSEDGTSFRAEICSFGMNGLVDVRGLA